jgi:hypothetical protein
LIETKLQSDGTNHAPLLCGGVCRRNLTTEVRKHNPLFGVQDLKTYFRASKYLDETLKLLLQKPDPILIQQIFEQIMKIGSVNAS